MSEEKDAILGELISKIFGSTGESLMKNIGFNLANGAVSAATKKPGKVIKMANDRDRLVSAVAEMLKKVAEEEPEAFLEQAPKITGSIRGLASGSSVKPIVGDPSKAYKAWKANKAIGLKEPGAVEKFVKSVGSGLKNIAGKFIK